MPLLPLAAFAAFTLAAPVPAIKPTGSDWPSFRGPNHSGVSTEKGLLAEWPKDGPKLLWQKTDVKDIGTGYGSPAVVGGKIYLLGGDGAKQTANEFVTCLDSDGKQVWQTKLTTTEGKYNDGWGGGPRGTPTVDGDMVFVLGATGDVVALTADKGEVKWQKNLAKDFGGGIPFWGYSESVAVDGDHVVCTPGGKGGMVALNRKTGETVWQCKELEEPAGYSSIVIAEVGGVKQYITQTMKSGVGVRAKDGKLLWKVSELSRATAVIPTPVVDADGYVFFTAGYRAGCECYKLEKDADGTKAVKVYAKNPVVQNQHGGVVKVGDYIYGHSDTGNVWVCFDYKKGSDEPVWKDKGVGKGSVTAVGDSLFCYSEQSGKLARVKATDAGYEELGSFTIPTTSKLRPNQGKVWAHPVVSGGKLFLRDYELLYVYDVANK